MASIHISKKRIFRQTKRPYIDEEIYLVSRLAILFIKYP